MKIIKIGALWCDIEEYNVGDTLTVLVFKKDDKEIDRLIGEKTKSEIEEVIKKYEED